MFPDWVASEQNPHELYLLKLGDYTNLLRVQLLAHPWGPAKQAQGQ